MRDKTASLAVVFEKVLRAFETGGFTYTDVVAQLKRLLTSGASPTELLEVLRREELNEPLPEHVHEKVLDLLNEAVGRAAAQAAVSEVQAPIKATPVALTSVFEKVLNAIETHDFSDADVVAELQRLLLVTEASPAALLEIMRRRKLIEPLSENAYAEVLGVLNEAMRRAGVPIEPDEALKPTPSTPTVQIPDSLPAPPRVTPMAPPMEQTKRAAKASVVVTSLRPPELSPTGTPNRTTPTVSVPPTPIQIALTKAARPVSSRIPTTSPAKAPDPTPTVTPGPIPGIGPGRGPAEGERAVVTPTRSPPPSSAPPKSGTPTPIPVQPTTSSSSPASAVAAKTETPPLVSAQTIALSLFPESTSTQRPAMEPNTAVPLTRTPTPDTVAAKTETPPPAPAQTSAPDSSPASTAVSKPEPTTIPAPPPWAVEAAVADEVTIELDGFDQVIEQPTVIEEALSRDSVEVGDVLLDRYRLVALIGEGGMSRVFKATDLGKTTSVSPDSHIAVKVFRSPISEDNGSFAAFRKEVQKLRGLTHPNMVRVFDCDRDGSIAFITMEYLAGPSLYAKLYGGAAAGKPPSGLGRDEAQHIILAVADALDYAHRNGVVHGDLKPGNIVVQNRGEIKIIDFDMARWVARPEAGVERRESPQQGSPPGVTPGYASPQLMAGQKPEPADDVYALACLAYELLTGTHPFDEAGVGAQSLKFPPPHRAELSAPQYSALVHGLQPDGNDRTRTVRQFVAEFSAPLRRAGWKPGAIGRTIKSGVIARTIKSGLIARAINPRVIARAAGVAAAALAFVVVAWFSIHRAPAPAPAASSPAVPTPGTVIRDCPTCPAMTVLPAGRFKQGSAPAENGFAFAKPQHWVAIGSSFAMSTNAVTVDEFHEFITASGRDMQGCDTYDGEWKHRPKNNWKNPGFAQAGTHPVTCASWNDAEAYARWLSTETKHRYRLPSASEWEYAARAGGEAVQPWSADGSSACANANLADESAAHRYPGWTVFGCDDGYVYTAPVGSFKANSFGLNDMLGNVLQWTEDCWRPDYSGAPIDGSARTDGNCSERELRGSSWFTTPAYVRADYRNHFAIDHRTSSVGIRLIRDIEQ